VKRRVDSRGRRQFASKASPAELARRRDHVLRFWRDGYMRSDIAAALDVSPSAVHEDLAKMGVRGERRMHALVEGKPPRTFWMDEDVNPAPDPGAHYLNSLALEMLDNSVDYITRQGIVNLFSHDVHDALRAGDDAWISKARSKLARANLLLMRLHGVLDSPAIRERGMRDMPEGDSPPFLRVIEGE
jgi:hypothetical protein